MFCLVTDGDFIEVGPVMSEPTVQSTAVTISDDTDVLSGQSPSDQCPPVSADLPDSQVADGGNIFEGLSQVCFFYKSEIIKLNLDVTTYANCAGKLHLL